MNRKQKNDAKKKRIQSLPPVKRPSDTIPPDFLFTDPQPPPELPLSPKRNVTMRQSVMLMNPKQMLDLVGLQIPTNALNDNDFGNLDSRTNLELEKGDVARIKTDRKNRNSTLLLKADDGDLGGLVRRPTMKPFRNTHQVRNQLQLIIINSKQNSNYLGFRKRRRTGKAPHSVQKEHDIVPSINHQRIPKQSPRINSRRAKTSIQAKFGRYWLAPRFSNRRTRRGKENCHGTTGKHLYKSQSEPSFLGQPKPARTRKLGPYDVLFLEPNFQPKFERLSLPNLFNNQTETSQYSWKQ